MVLAVVLAAGVAVPAGAGVRGREVGGVVLWSGAAGELSVSWEAPGSVPLGYRVMWAREDLGYLSYWEADEAHRGNAWPGGDASSVTLSGLQEGAVYKVQVRARFRSLEGKVSASPWTDEVTAVVSSSPAARQQQSGAPEAAEQQADEQQADEPGSAEPPLTAGFEGVPDAHGGAGSDLVVRVRFSEPLAVSYVTMRDGGAVLVSSEHRVVKAKRVERRSDLWDITIRVGSDATVTVTVPEGSGCEGANAVCTADGRPVAQRALVFVPGPGSDPDDPRVDRYGPHTVNQQQPDDTHADHDDDPPLIAQHQRLEPNGEQDSGDEEAGTAEAAVPAPARPTAADAGLSSISVRWTAPEHPETPITGYDLRYRAVGASEWSDGPQDVAASPAEITGLQADTAYEVAVRAQGDGAESEWSEPGRGSTAFWVATLTVGSLDQSTNGYWGFQNKLNRFGDLTPRTHTRDGVSYEFLILAWYRGYRVDADGRTHTEALDFYGYDHVMPADWVLRIEDRQFRFRDATRGFLQTNTPQQTRQYKVYWRHPELSLELGSRIEVSLSQEPTEPRAIQD